MVTINLTPASVISASVSESTISVSLTTTPISVTVSDGFTVAAGDTRYLRRANNLSGLANTGTARTNLGLVAGGAGDIWVEKAGDVMTGVLNIQEGAGSGALIMGADVNANTLTNGVRKVARINVPAYDDVTKKVQVFSGDFDSGGNGVYFGGFPGGSQYAATEIFFYTAANATTTGGTERMRVTRGGDVGIGINPTAHLHVKGIADKIQQVIRAYSTQTPNLVEFQDGPGEKGIAISPDAKELRFYDVGESNYVGFEAPALSANQIWVLPTTDGNDGDVFTTNGSGTLSWLSGASEKSWAFRSRSGASGTTYTGGFYEHSGSANDFSTGPIFGTANAARAAHFFIVTGADTVDELTIRITGTSILDTGGSRATSSTEDIVIPNSTTAGAYYETTKKWLGTVTITIVSGTAKICDFGFAKYWDNNNTDFAVVGLEATWLGGATDTDPNLILRHHKGTDGNTDFTYTGSGATPPTAIAAMATDHVTEDNVINGENGVWKRDDLSVSVNGSGKEGTILEIITTANKTFELGTLLLRITPQ